MPTCKCGCGVDCSVHYRPGHDARHVKQLVTQTMEATPPAPNLRDQLPSDGLRAKFDKQLASKIAKRDAPRAEPKPRKAPELSTTTVDRLQAMLDSRYWTGQQGVTLAEGWPAKVRHYDPETQTMTIVVETPSGPRRRDNQPKSAFCKKEHADAA